MRCMAMILAAVLTAGGSAAASDLTVFVTNGWTASSHCDDRTGKFLQCMAYASHQDGISVVVGVDQRRRWTLGFGNMKWHMAAASVPFSYSFDGGAWKSARGSVSNRTFLTVDLDSNKHLSDLLARSRFMEIEANGDEYYLPLFDIPTVLAKLADCVRLQADQSCTRLVPCPMLGAH